MYSHESILHYYLHNSLFPLCMHLFITSFWKLYSFKCFSDFNKWKWGRTRFKIDKIIQETNAENVLNDKLTKGNLLYFGRETCPFCREFLPVLKETSDLYHTPFKIYYLNTEDSHKNSQIKKAMEKYNVTGVPTLIYLKKDNGFEVLNEERTTLPEWFNIIMKYWTFSKNTPLFQKISYNFPFMLY